ncbi:MAG: cupin domain-containing protein [Pseudomonadota bacterium]
MSGWQVCDINAVSEKQSNTENGDLSVSYRECLRVPSMHCGVYRLAAGSSDMQSPHDEDEMYFVLKGRGSLRVGDQSQAVYPGMLLYVEASQDHSFFEIEEDMELLVMFATGQSGH